MFDISLLIFVEFENQGHKPEFTVIEDEKCLKSESELGKASCDALWVNAGGNDTVPSVECFVLKCSVRPRVRTLYFA